MNVGELRQALANYPDDTNIKIVIDEVLIQFREAEVAGIGTSADGDPTTISIWPRPTADDRSALAMFGGDLPDGGWRVECGACEAKTDLPPNEQDPYRPLFPVLGRCSSCNVKLIYPSGASW